MIYKAILKSIEAKESWDNNGDKWTKYIFTFDNGHAPFVFRTDELNYKKGSELEYDLDKNNNKARILTKNPKENQTEVSYTTTKDDVQKYIIRQSSMNRATDLYQGQLFDWEKQENRNKLIKLAREIEKYVHNG